MKTYQTETGALISESDYNHLSSAQQRKCTLGVRSAEEILNDNNVMVGHKVVKAMHDFHNQFDQDKWVSVIRNYYVASLPTGEVKAWDFVQHAKEFTKYLDEFKTTNNGTN